jgi:hypothetical protein
MLEKPSPKEVKWGGGVYMDSKRSRQGQKEYGHALLFALCLFRIFL